MTIATQTSWGFDYRNVRGIVQLTDECKWTSYISLGGHKMTDEQKALFLLPETLPINQGVDYFDSALAQLPWHGGCTYYKINYDKTGAIGCQVGCDYNHLDDIGRGYDMEFVKRELITVIDVFADQFPSYGEVTA
jgi:hypothetical protein